MQNLLKWLSKPVNIAPLVVFRILFGAVLTLSTVRFWAMGWIDAHFIQPKLMFKYYGFEWVQVLPPLGMYLVHGFMIIASICILIGFFYHFFAILLFLLFTYTFLLDATYYLNHYYFVCLITFVMCFLPANRYLAIDIYLKPEKLQQTIPNWCILLIKFQLTVAYFYAGVVKINYDWLILALPLKIWLPAQDKIFIIGFLFKYKFVAYLFSWIGIFYDLTIVFWLSFNKTKNWAYLTVILFHVLTGILFQIGIFPIVMIACTTIFLDNKLHIKIIRYLKLILINFNLKFKNDSKKYLCRKYFAVNNFIISGISLYVIAQILIPIRFLLYNDSIYWTENGYRFSWRVMLMEKAGTATFYIKDLKTKHTSIVNNRDFLTLHQEKQMAMQPDLILQYAHFLKKYYRQIIKNDLAIYSEVYVTINGRISSLYIDKKVDLSLEKDSFFQKKWVLSSSINKQSKF